MKVIYDPPVLEELILLAGYLADESEATAHRFLDACDESFLFLAENKFIGVRKEFSNPALSDIRMWRVKNFENHVIFYAPMESGVRILHIIHSRRDWKGLFDDEAK